jgi:hypothetical protein
MGGVCRSPRGGVERPRYLIPPFTGPRPADTVGCRSATSGTFELPAADGTLTVAKSASIGGVMQITIKGTFTVTKTRK